MHTKTMGLWLAGVIVAMLVVPTTALTASNVKNVTTRKTPSLDRGNFGVRVRSLSATRINTKLVLTVTVRRATRVSFTAKPCRRVTGGFSCDSAKQRRSDSVRLRPGRNRILRRIDVRGTRRITCARVDVRERRAGRWRTLVPGARGVVVCTA